VHDVNESVDLVFASNVRCLAVVCLALSVFVDTYRRCHVTDHFRVQVEYNAVRFACAHVSGQLFIS